MDLNNLQLTSAAKNRVTDVESFVCYRLIWAEFHSSFPTTRCDCKVRHVAAVSIKDIWWSKVFWPSRRLVTHIRDLDIIIRQTSLTPLQIKIVKCDQDFGVIFGFNDPTRIQREKVRRKYDWRNSLLVHKKHDFFRLGTRCNRSQFRS